MEILGRPFPALGSGDGDAPQNFEPPFDDAAREEHAAMAQWESEAEERRARKAAFNFNKRRVGDIDTRKMRKNVELTSTDLLMRQLPMGLSAGEPDAVERAEMLVIVEAIVERTRHLGDDEAYSLARMIQAMLQDPRLAHGRLRDVLSEAIWRFVVRLREICG